MQLLARRLHVLAAALAGLEAGDASDATITLRAGHADDAAACEQFVQELAAMYVGWADARGMRIRRSGVDKVVLEVNGLGAYTLLKPETGLHVLELPVPERSFDRATVVVAVEPADGDGEGATNGAEPVVVRRYRHEPSPLVRDASGMRTGRIDRVLAGDFDLLADATD